jgi:hypothetical protein
VSKACHRCRLSRFIEKATKKAEEWKSVGAIARTHQRRIREMEVEAASVEHVDDCPQKPRIEQ